MPTDDGGRAGRAAVGPRAGEDRQPERQGLAGTRRGHAADVAPAEGVGERGGLDGKRRRDASAFENRRQRRWNAQIAKAGGPSEVEGAVARLQSVLRKRWPTRCTSRGPWPATNAGRQRASARGFDAYGSRAAGRFGPPSHSVALRCRALAGRTTRIRRRSSETVWLRGRDIQRRGPMATKRVQMPEEDLVRLYLKDVGRYALLTKDDEVRLAQAAEAGHDARTELATRGGLRANRKRALHRIVGGRRRRHRDSGQRQPPTGGIDRQEVPTGPTCRCSTSSRRATSGSSTPSRSSTGGRASSSPRTPPGGSARRSPGASNEAAEPFGCRPKPARCSRRRPNPGLGSKRSSVGADGRGAVRRPRRRRRQRSPRSSVTRPRRVSLSEPLGDDGGLQVGDLVEDQQSRIAVRSGRGDPARRRSGPDADRPGRPRTRGHTAAVRTGPRRTTHAQRSRRPFRPHPGEDRQIESRAMSKLRHPTTERL